MRRDESERHTGGVGVGSLNSLSVKLVMRTWMSSHSSLNLCETGMIFSHAWTAVRIERHTEKKVSNQLHGM